jgi:NAD(P)H-quinone oxidoreductase subunit 4
MLREMFYGKENTELKGLVLLDAKPREVFITACLLLPVVGFGLYPKLLTQTYDAKIVQVASHARTAVSTVAQQPVHLFTQVSAAPSLSKTAATSELLGIVK